MDQSAATLDYLWQIPLAVGLLRIAWRLWTAPFVVSFPQEKKR